MRIISDNILDDNINVSKDILISLDSSYEYYNLIDNSNKIRYKIVRCESI